MIEVVLSGYTLIPQRCLSCGASSDVDIKYGSPSHLTHVSLCISCAGTANFELDMALDAIETKAAEEDEFSEEESGIVDETDYTEHTIKIG